MRVPTGFELFRNFSKTNVSQENFIRHLLANNYCKNSKNDKYNKIVDLQRGKAKKALLKFTNFAKNAKVTRLFFLAIKKDRVTNVTRIARMANSAKFQT